MQIVLKCVLAVVALWLGARIASADPQYIADPDKFAATLCICWPRKMYRRHPK
jgi:hypothetical protein